MLGSRAIIALVAMMLGVLVLFFQHGAPRAGHMGGQKTILVEKAWVGASLVKNRPVAAYFTLHNQSTERLILLTARTKRAREATFHVSFKNEKGVMKMLPLKEIRLVGGETLHFAPGGRHLMLYGLTSPLKPGEEIPITLLFKHHSPVEVMFRVQKPGRRGKMRHHE